MDVFLGELIDRPLLFNYASGNGSRSFMNGRVCGEL